MTDHRTLANRLHEARLTAGKTQSEAARILGCTAQAISNWERGCTRIDCVSLFRLLEGYGTDICAFLRRCGVAIPEKKSTDTAMDPQLLEAHSRMTPEQRDTLRRIACVLAESSREKAPAAVPKHRIIPLYHYLAAAGYPSPAPGEDYEDYSVPYDSPADFAAKIDGDSMEPWIHSGDIVLAQRRVDLRDGDVGIFYAKDGMVCKQYCQDSQGNIYLFSLNRERRDADVMISAASDLRLLCYGKVLMPRQIPLPTD